MERRVDMGQKLKLWYDPEADFLEVLFSDQPGFMKETENESVMERVDNEGHILGFSIMNVSHFTKENPLQTELVA